MGSTYTTTNKIGQTLKDLILTPVKTFNDFYWRLSACVERHSPLIKVGKNHLKLVQKPWISAKIQKMIIHRDSLYDKWNKNRNDKITEKHCKKIGNPNMKISRTALTSIKPV